MREHLVIMTVSDRGLFCAATGIQILLSLRTHTLPLPAYYIGTDEVVTTSGTLLMGGQG